MNYEESEFERDFHAYVILNENPGMTWDEANRAASQEDKEIQEQGG